MFAAPGNSRVGVMRAPNRSACRVACALQLMLLCGALIARGSRAAPPAPPVHAIDSISVPVEDMDRSVSFYHGVLGFDQIADREVAGDAYVELLHFKASDHTEMSVWTTAVTAGTLMVWVRKNSA